MPRGTGDLPSRNQRGRKTRWQSHLGTAGDLVGRGAIYSMKSTHSQTRNHALATRDTGGSILSVAPTKPAVLGTGLIALDVVVGPQPGAAPRCWAGGTCGNVLTILAYFGWRSYPAATLGNDVA